MTNREKEILKLIKENPMISQKELADKLGITRSSAAVHITNMIKKGYIRGKGYIVSDNPYICIVGGANMDIQGFPNSNLILEDSNPGKVSISMGGVGRNIGENLTRMGAETRLISAVGDDVYGHKILDEARKIGLDMNDSIVMNGANTSTYLSILDETGDMKVAIAHMDIFDKISIDFIKSKKEIIENSKLCILDTNIPEEVLDYILNNFQGTFFLDCVSSTKAKKVKNNIGKFHTIKPNRIEAEILSGIKITCEEDIEKCAQYFIDEGVSQVFISLGEDGIYYKSREDEGHIRCEKVKVINATGAGDAFIAGLAYSQLKDFNIRDAAKYAMSASILAIQHEDTINPNMSSESMEKTMMSLKFN